MKRLSDNRRYNPLPLYYDAECIRPVPYSIENGQVLYEAMSFKKLDGGTQGISQFYIRNTSMGAIEDLLIHVESVNKDDVSVTLVSPSVVNALASREVYRGRLRWEAKRGGKAGQCQCRIVVSGMLTQEY